MISFALLLAAALGSSVKPHALPRDSTSLTPDSVLASVTAPATAPVIGPRRVPSVFLVPARSVAVDTPTVRPRAIEYSDWYNRRLTLHRWGSYATLPLFATQYWLGQKLIDNPGQNTRDQHALAAGGIAALFGLNTLTGAWNLWEARRDPAGRTRRTVHAALLMLADAGFVATGASAGDDGEFRDGDAGESRGNASTHRRLAIGSMAIAAVGTTMMWFWKD